MQGRYMKLHYDLMENRKIYSKKEYKFVDITTNEMLIYLYMRSKYIFFSEEEKEYFESQDSISTKTNTDRKTVNKAIKKLVDIGVIVATEFERIGYIVKNKYIVLDAICSEEELKDSQTKKTNKLKIIQEIDDDPDWVSPY